MPEEIIKQINKPVLKTMLELLKFKNRASYTEISRVSGVKQIKVLSILNKNTQLFSVNSLGAIVGVEAFRTWLLKKITDEGLAFRMKQADTYDYADFKYLSFNGHPELLETLGEPKKKKYEGSGVIPLKFVVDKPENVVSLKLAGLLDGDEFVKQASIEDYWDEQ